MYRHIPDPRPKSPVAAFLLCFFFGTLGLFYVVKPWPAVGLNLAAFVVTVVTAGLAAIIIWPATIIYCTIAANRPVAGSLSSPPPRPELFSPPQRPDEVPKAGD
jgi:hypothetical protein